MESYKKVSLTIDTEILPAFFGILRKGVKVDGDVGLSIGNFLRKGMGMSPEYIEGRIQTIFLNGKPVDNVEAAAVEDGDVMALSASMPGLAGATLRKGGHFAGLRSAISYSEKEAVKSTGRGRITIKLFNLLTKEMAPLFLEHGVIVGGDDLAAFLNSQYKTSRAALKSIEIDGKRADTEQLEKTDWSQKEVFLRVNVSESPAGNGRKEA
ncbi:hypothetical protein ACFL2O_03600 [Thermodesulfobacteriota bacterium]